MGALRKKTISLALVFALTTSSYADLGNFIENNLDASIQSTSAGYFKSQVSGYYTLGRVKVRWGGLGKVYPFNFQPPKMNVGCSGIDMVWGGFSYLNFEYLVAKLKKIAAAAPAFAFQTAIRTLCEQCGTIMDNLEKIADMINGLNFDSCQAAHKIGDKMAGWITNDLIRDGKKDNWIEASAETINQPLTAVANWLGELNKKFGSAGTEGGKNALGYGSVLKKATQKYVSAMGGDEDYLLLMRATLGDVYGYAVQQNASDGSSQSSLSKIEIISPTASVDDIFKVMKDGGEIEAIKITDNKNGTIYLAPSISPQKITIPQDKALFRLIKNKLTAITNKVRTNQKLSASDIAFMNAMPLPVYKIININSVIGDEQIIDNVAEYMSYKVTEAFINFYFNELKKNIALFLADPRNNASMNEEVRAYLTQTLLPRVKELNTKLNIMMSKVGNDIKTQTDLLDYYKDVERQLVRRSQIWNAASL